MYQGLTRTLNRPCSQVNKMKIVYYFKSNKILFKHHYFDNKNYFRIFLEIFYKITIILFIVKSTSILLIWFYWIYYLSNNNKVNANNNFFIQYRIKKNIKLSQHLTIYNICVCVCSVCNELFFLFVCIHYRLHLIMFTL